jgi:hypothetical protein
LEEELSPSTLELEKTALLLESNPPVVSLEEELSPVALELKTTELLESSTTLELDEEPLLSSSPLDEQENMNTMANEMPANNRK